MKIQKNTWQFLGSSLDGQIFKIEGINIWEKSWLNQNISVEVTDPKYGEKKLFTVFKILEENKEIEFAAGEFSNFVWGFYIRKNKEDLSYSDR